MKQLEFKKELNLDNPADVDWLMEWSKQAWERIKELEAEQSNRLEKLVMPQADEIAELIASAKDMVNEYDHKLRKFGYPQLDDIERWVRNIRESLQGLTA